MRIKYKSVIVSFLALLFMGITFPELVYTDDSVKIVDEKGKEIIDFSELPGDAIDHIKALYEEAEEGKIIIRFKLLETIQEQNADKE